MPDGFQIGKNAHTFAGGFSEDWQLIDAAAAPDVGFWVDVHEFRKLTVDVTGTFTGLNLVIMGSNAQNIPTNATDGNQIGAAITTAGITSISDYPVKWLKVKVLGITTGSVTVTLHAVTP